MPYLTPEEIPEEDVCRPLFIPASTEWLALISGALTELTKAYNWEQFGALTVDETVEKMQSIIDDYYAGGCSDCTTPGGYRVVRLNEDGQVEQLNSDGEWEAGTGDYYIPPPAARTGGTEEDQICLAAANAVNVLAELYESLSDSWNNSLDNHEMLTAAIAIVTSAVGFAFAPITWAVAAFALVIIAGAYAALEFIGADLWTNDVTEQIKCFLFDCATNNAGVVTFDYWCFIDKLNSLANDFSLTEGQLRLYVQIGYLFYFIGGIDGLNLAGRTTAITSADCDNCGPQVWAYYWNFLDADRWTAFDSEAGETDGHWNDTEGYAGDSTGHGNAQFGTLYDVARKSADFDIPAGSEITFMQIFETAGGGIGSHQELWVGANRTEGLGRDMKIYQSAWAASEDVQGVIGEATGQHMTFQSGNGGDKLVEGVRVEGTGEMPNFTGGEVV